MKAIFDKVQFFTIIFLNISEKPTKNILIFRTTFGNPYSRAKTDYYQLSPIRYFLTQSQLNMVNFHKCSVFGTR